MTAPVGEVTTPMTSGQIGQPLLAFLGEEPLGGEALAPLLEEFEQCADAGQLDGVDDELILRAAGIGRQAAGADHLHAVLGLHRKAHRGHAPAHRVEHRVGILQRHIAMAGGNGA